MRILDKQFLNEIDIRAKNSARKRAHFNLHEDYNEKVQRLFIALTKGSYVEPHYHELPNQWEMFIVIEGVVKVTFYSCDGKIIESLHVGENQSCKVVEIHPNDIHSVECMSDRALMLEVKEGPFYPDFAKVMANFNKE